MIFCHTNIITKVSSYSNLKEKKIISITIPFDRHSGLSKKQKEIFSKSKLNLRLNILKVNGDSLGDLIYSSSIKNILTGKIDELTFSTKELNLKFSEDGFYLQLENLGAVDENGEFITCNNGLFMARVKISDKESKEYKIESYRLAKNGSVDLEKQLNYTQSFGKNDLDKNYFLNYRFKYYE